MKTGLIAEIGLGHAGLVLSLDASRLARNNRDWYQLVELCALFGVLIADGPIEDVIAEYTGEKKS